MPKWPKSQMPSSLHGVFSFVLYRQFEVAVPTGKGGRGKITCSSNGGAFKTSIEKMSIRAVQEKMDEAFRAASDGVSLILFQKGHPTKRADFSRHGYRAAQFEDAFARFLPHEPNIRTLKSGRERT